MNRLLQLLLFPLLLLVFALPTSCNRTSGDIEDLSWMIGSWQGRDVTNNMTWHESWERSGKSLTGSVSTLALDGDTVYRETLKIDLVDGTPYFVETVPGSKGPVLFKMVKSDKQNAVFENREHDFPQRISYQLESNNSMSVELEGIEKGHPKSETLHFERVTNDLPNPQPPVQ